MRAKPPEPEEPVRAMTSDGPAPTAPAEPILPPNRALAVLSDGSVKDPVPV